jgi:hypothetical protein
MLQACKRVPVRSRSLIALIAAVALLPAQLLAQSGPLPDSVRACAGETDPARRLSCYDKEVARDVQAPSPAPEQQPTGDGGKSISGAQPPDVPAPQGAPQPQDPRKKRVSFPLGLDSGQGTVVAQLLSIEHPASGRLLRLDNGQVWQQVLPVAGDLSLRVGDTVKIEKRLGSFWLSGPHVRGMSVRPK